MVSPNDRLCGQPINGSNGLASHSSSDSVGNSTETQDNETVVVNCLQLHRFLQNMSFIDSERQLFIGIESDGEPQLCLGAVDVSVQRRSITKDMMVLANGLKPIKGSANKFSVNQINDNKETNGCNRSESVIQFTQTKDNYPISIDTNIVATGLQSQLFIKDENQLIEIKPKHGFVLIDSELTVFDGKQVDLNVNHYNSQQKGNLFVLGTGIHLLIVDKSKPNQTILFVGTGGMTAHSLSNNQMNDQNFSDKCVDRPLFLKKCCLISEQQNCSKNYLECKPYKRQINDSDSMSKRQKCEDWPHSQSFVDTTQS